ncbi:helix-turn-helix transcriptional regulator [Thiocapsa roseopersicina]|uniref:helix-turn-helix transcriptional regulator n=1 Tax=Thiocapsa roseopersicina TaxID=1058 RepID=UPI000B819826
MVRATSSIETWSVGRGYGGPISLRYAPWRAKRRRVAYETGEHDPSEATALKIAEVFGVPLAYLFTPDQRLGDIIRGYDRMDEAGRARLAELAATLVASSNP